MFKRSPSRPRSKSVKVKHILQICLLLGVCFWLIYQVKHSHDKKKEFSEKDAKHSVNAQSDGELPRLGRKDLPHLEQVTEKENHQEEEEKVNGGEEEENKPDEEEREEEESKLEVEEQEEEENKNEDIEDEERGGGDDETDENDEEKLGREADRDEEFVDEEKEREEEHDEKDSERSMDKESQVANENFSEDQDHDVGDQNTHEAREENYKGDDASSAVTHDTQTIISETEKVSSENSIEKSEVSILEKENKSNHTEEINSDQNNLIVKARGDEMTRNGTSLSVIDVESKGNDNSYNSADSSVSNSTVTTQSGDHPEAINNTSMLSTNAGNNSTEVSTEGHATALTGTDTSDSPQQNGTVPVPDAAHAHNLTVDVLTTGDGVSVQSLKIEETNSSATVSGSNQSDGNLKLSVKIENVKADAGESSTSPSNSKSAVSENLTGETEKGSGSLATKENADATENDKSSDSVQHDPIDASDSHFALTEKEVRTDLDTLPEIRTEGDNSEDTAAE